MVILFAIRPTNAQGSSGFIINMFQIFYMVAISPYLRTHHRGPGPGRHIKKKSRLKYGMREKKAVHERGIVELINCTWKLIDNTVLYFL
jgi:hypothetical protein